MDTQPYLSVVAAGRNDDHGGDFLARAQLFVNGLLEQASEYRLTGELIFVEWNPPDDALPMHRAIDWSKASAQFPARIVCVPPDLHAHFQNLANLSFFQMIAKNVGIRRARGQFILATNSDIVFSAELMQTLASRSLRPGHLYRANRYDVARDYPDHMTTAELLLFFRMNVKRMFLRNWTVTLQEPAEPNPVILWLGSNRDLVAGLGRVLYRTRNSRRQLPGQIKNGLAARWGIGHPKHSSYRLPNLHYNACGDFTLMAREDWFKLLGYPEFATYSLHIDSLLCSVAYFSGIRELVLKDPRCVYHIEHHSGWTNDEKSNQELESQMKQRQVTMLTGQHLVDYVRQMSERTRPLIFNNDDWGLGNRILPEFAFPSISLLP
jgi:hypothetical protein